MFQPLKEFLLPFPERHDFRLVPCRPIFLQPVDFPLQRRAFAVVPQALERPGAIGGILGRGSRLAGDVPDERGFSCT
jgi:hypothetical protein